MIFVVRKNCIQKLKDYVKQANIQADRVDFEILKFFTHNSGEVKFDKLKKNVSVLYCHVYRSIGELCSLVSQICISLPN